MTIYKSNQFQNTPHQYPDNSDELFDRIQGSKTMAGAMQVFNGYMNQPAPLREKTEWETIWPRISLALLEQCPEEEFPDPTASFTEIWQFIMSSNGPNLLQSIRKIDLSGLELEKVPNVLLKGKNLEIIDLSSNPRIRELPAWVLRLPQLKTLDIENTAIREFPPHHASDTNLETLIVSWDLKKHLPPMEHLEIISYRVAEDEHKEPPMQNRELAERGLSRWHHEIRKCEAKYPGLLGRMRENGFKG